MVAGGWVNGWHDGSDRSSRRATNDIGTTGRAYLRGIPPGLVGGLSFPEAFHIGTDGIVESVLVVGGANGRVARQGGAVGKLRGARVGIGRGIGREERGEKGGKETR